MSIREKGKRAVRWCLYRAVFPLLYRLGSLRPVRKNRAVFVCVRSEGQRSSFQRLCEELEEKYNCETQVCTLYWQMSGKRQFLKNSMEMIWAISDARAVFVTDACNLFSAFRRRRGTTVVNLWHGCGAFKKFGYSTVSDRGKWGATAEEVKKYPLYANLDYFTVSSPEVVWAYRDATHLREDQVVPVGVSRTDIFFDAAFIRAARDKLHAFFPALGDKKVILYAPTFRGRLREAKTAEALDYGMLCDKLKDQYILLVKHHAFVKKRPPIPKETEGFATDMTDRMSVEELMCACDVCISDYSSLIFEYSLLEKPLAFFAYDLEEYDDFRGFYYPYEEMTPGPVLKSNEEVLQFLLQLAEGYDRERLLAFKNKFMASCDGNATQRIIRLAFGDDLEAFRREEEGK